VALDVLAALAVADRADLLDRVDLKDNPVHRDDPANPVLLVPKETVVSVRNTVPWMAEFSSKMEPDDRLRTLHGIFVLLCATTSISLRISRKTSS
jgi:hypothetical protein